MRFAVSEVVLCDQLAISVGLHSFNVVNLEWVKPFHLPQLTLLACNCNTAALQLEPKSDSDSFQSSIMQLSVHELSEHALSVHELSVREQLAV